MPNVTVRGAPLTKAKRSRRTLKKTKLQNRQRAARPFDRLVRPSNNPPKPKLPPTKTDRIAPNAKPKDDWTLPTKLNEGNVNNTQSQQQSWNSLTEKCRIDKNETTQQLKLDHNLPHKKAIRRERMPENAAQQKPIVAAAG